EEQPGDEGRGDDDGGAHDEQTQSRVRGRRGDLPARVAERSERVGDPRDGEHGGEREEGGARPGTGRRGEDGEEEDEHDAGEPRAAQGGRGGEEPGGALVEPQRPDRTFDPG